MPVTITQDANKELKALIAKELEAKRMTPEAGLRLMVIGGGCSGFSYKMGFDENISENDRIFELDGVKVVVDEKSYLYLDGTQVDYHESLMGRGFVFSNPNASGTCGCGSSFSV